jgi:hypothetical protein
MYGYTALIAAVNNNDFEMLDVLFNSENLNLATDFNNIFYDPLNIYKKSDFLLQNKNIRVNNDDDDETKKNKIDFEPWKLEVDKPAVTRTTKMTALHYAARIGFNFAYNVYFFLQFLIIVYIKINK